MNIQINFSKGSKVFFWPAYPYNDFTMEYTVTLSQTDISVGSKGAYSNELNHAGM